MKNRNEKKILISMLTGEGNSGDEAIIYCMKQQISKCVGQPCSFTAFTSDARVSEKYVDMNFIYSGRYGLKDPAQKGFAKFAWIFRTISAIAKCDILITGGGSVLQDQTNRFYVPFWFIKIALAQLFCKPTMMYGIGCGPLTRKSSRFLMNTFGRKIRYMAVRGPLSKEWVSKFKIRPERVVLTADPAVTLEKAPESELECMLERENITLEPGRDFVVFAVREWFKKPGKGLDSKNEESIRSYKEYIGAIAKYAKYLTEEQNMDVVFIPHTKIWFLDDTETAHDIIDEMRNTGANTSRVFSIDETYHPTIYKALIAHAKIVFSVRFHTVVYATSQSIPAIGAAYGNKTFDYLNYIGIPECAVGIGEISFDKLRQMHENIIRHYDSIVSKLEESSVYQKKMAMENAKLVRQLLGGTSKEEC